MFKFLQKAITANKPKVLQVSKNFSVPLADFLSTGERDAILASSGMGKSYLTGVLLEETLENGTLVCIIDPEGEHFTLAEKYPCLIIGGEHAHVPFDPAGVELYIEAMITTGLSTIFDLSDYIDTEQQDYYAIIGDALFRLEQKYRRKVRLVVEEAQIYAPQNGGGGAGKKKNKGLDAITVSQRIAKRGRKRALDSLWATQRPASLSKDILSQCNRFWFGGITSELDYKLEQSEIQRLQELLRKQERKIEQLREELERERMATKVIERLGGNSMQATGEALAGMDFDELASLEAGTAKRSRRRKLKDSGDIASPASDVSISTWVEPGKIQL